MGAMSKSGIEKSKSGNSTDMISSMIASLISSGSEKSNSVLKSKSLSSVAFALSYHGQLGSYRASNEHCKLYS